MDDGEKNVISFHGFGQDDKTYTVLLNNCPECTIYAFDLPFHGGTKINKQGSILFSEDLHELMTQLIDKAGISQFSIIAFSIGAKMAFPIIEKYASMIDRIWLIAPDGIQSNFWYQLLTRNRMMRFIFQKAMKKPGIVLSVVRLLKSLNVLNRQIATLTAKSINTRKQRDRVFHTWTYLRKLNYRRADLSRILGQVGIRVIFILGENDHVIPVSGIKKMNSALNNSEIIMLPCGHFNLIKCFSGWLTSNEQRL